MVPLALIGTILGLLPQVLDLVLRAEERYRTAGAGAKKKAYVVKAIAADVARVTKQTGLVKGKQAEARIDAVHGVVGGVVDAVVGILNANELFTHGGGDAA